MIEKPINDHRLYRHITLPNKMEALAISDSKCDKASCAMACRVGSLFDPADVPGLAHFLEHMLFLGTEKYPQEDSYNEYLAKHGGHSNAYTSSTQTVYYFSVAPEALPDAVDHFAQFFISPLFTQSATDREINAVNSEHAKNKQSDAWRFQQLLRNSANPKHPLNRFSTGDIDTLKNEPARLGIDVRQRLLDFHQKYYSSNEMRLAVLGKGSLDDIEKLIMEKFKDVVNKNIAIPRGEEIGNGEMPVLPDSLGSVTYVVPVRDSRSVTFQFMLPEQTENWESKPWRYFSHLLGHEGKGSVLSLLKAKSLSTELSSGSAADEAGLCVFSVEVHLTEQGNTHEGIRVVGETLFAYLRMLRDRSVDKPLWDEMQKLEDMNFMFRSLPDPSSAAISCATGMLEFPVDKVLSGPSRLWTFEPAKIDHLLSLFGTDNMRVVCVSKRYADKCTATDKYYGTEHIVERLPEDWREAWNGVTLPGESLFLPATNPFIPTDLELRPLAGTQADAPVRSHMPNCHVYHKQDDTFKLPKAILGFVFYSPFTAASSRNSMMAEVFFQCVMEELNEYAYDAEIAGLSYKLSADTRCCVLEVAGYHDKIGEIMGAIATKIAGYKEIPQKTWDIVHTRMLRDLQNAATKRQPYMQAFSYERRLTTTPFYLFEERLEEFLKLKIEDFSGLHEKLFQDRFTECLIQGNVTREETRSLLTKFFDTLPTPRPLQDIPKCEVTMVQNDVHMCLRGTNPEEKNSASIVAIQIGEDTIETSTLVNLATQVLGQRFYDDLRTKQQFGYIVSMQASRKSGYLMEMNYIVQTEKPVWEATEKINEFIKQNSTMLVGLSDEDFETYRQALLTILEEKPKKLGDEWVRNWQPIRDRNFNFVRKEQQAEYLRKLTRADFNEFAKSLETRKRVVSEVCAAHHWDQRPEGGIATVEQLREAMEKETNKIQGPTKIEPEGTAL